MSKILDYNGLEHYDEKIKNYLCSVNIFNDINMNNMNAFAYYSDDDLHRVVASNEMIRKL